MGACGGKGQYQVSSFVTSSCVLRQVHWVHWLDCQVPGIFLSLPPGTGLWVQGTILAFNRFQRSQFCLPTECSPAPTLCVCVFKDLFIYSMYVNTLSLFMFLRQYISLRGLVCPQPPHIDQTELGQSSTMLPLPSKDWSYRCAPYAQLII